MNNPLIIWLILSVVIALVHVYFIKVKKRSPNKAVWLWARSILGALFVIYEFYTGIHNPIVVSIAYFFSAWFIHDTIIPLCMGKKPWYLNSTGPIDKASPQTPYFWLFKGFVAVIVSIIYFLNEF